MKLAELIDLEVQLRRDEETVAGYRTKTDERCEAVARRDRTIGQRIAEAPELAGGNIAARLAEDRELRHLVCARWLAMLPGDVRQELPGERVERGYGVTGWLMLAVFCLIGIGTARGALSSSGTDPINVLVFVMIFFVLQILLLVLYPVLMLVRQVRGGDILPWLQGIVVRLSRVKFIDRWTGRAMADLPETLSRLRLRQTIYGKVQRWTLFSLVQRMATGFNLAALLTCLYMVTFHDLAFCWSTTLDVQPTDLHRWLGWIATPWSWIGDLGEPSAEAIQVSRWVPVEGDYSDNARNAVDLRRGWWPFLMAGLITWGLLPRTLAYGVGTWYARRASRRLPLNHMVVQHLFERLFPPTASWSGPDPDSVVGEAPVVPLRPPPRPRASSTARCFVVCWGSLFTEAERVGAHIHARFQREVAKTLGAGLADVDVEEKTLGTLVKAKARRIVLALPEGQQPTKDVMHFVEDLRGGLGADCELVIGLLAAGDGGFTDVDADELDNWRTHILAHADPYLTLQTMGQQS